MKKLIAKVLVIGVVFGFSTSVIPSCDSCADCTMEIAECMTDPACNERSLRTIVEDWFDNCNPF